MNTKDCNREQFVTDVTQKDKDQDHVAPRGLTMDVDTLLQTVRSYRSSVNLRYVQHRRGDYGPVGMTYL